MLFPENVFSDAFVHGLQNRRGIDSAFMKLRSIMVAEYINSYSISIALIASCLLGFFSTYVSLFYSINLSIYIIVHVQCEQL